MFWSRWHWKRRNSPQDTVLYMQNIPKVEICKEVCDYSDKILWQRQKVSQTCIFFVPITFKFEIRQILLIAGSQNNCLLKIKGNWSTWNYTMNFHLGSVVEQDKLLCSKNSKGWDVFFVVKKNRRPMGVQHKTAFLLYCLNDILSFDWRIIPPWIICTWKRIFITGRGVGGTKLLCVSVPSLSLVCVYICVCMSFSPAVFALDPQGNMVGDHPCPTDLLVWGLEWAGRSDETLWNGRALHLPKKQPQKNLTCVAV